MKTICISNQKGGIGKTTTAQAFIELLRRAGYKVLAVDLDTQGNLSSLLGVEEGSIFIASALSGEMPMKGIIRNDLIAGNWETVTASKKTTPKALASMIEEAKAGYDLVIIDTPVTIDTLTLGALLASDIVIIPTTADKMSLDGIRSLENALNGIRKSGHRIESRALFVRYDARKILDRQIKAAFEQKRPCFYTGIRTSNAIREAQTAGKPLMTAYKSKAMKDYSEALKELLDILK